MNSSTANFDIPSCVDSDGFVEPEEQGLQSEVDDISEMQDNVRFMDEVFHESQANDLSENQENEVGCIEESGLESQIDDISENHENELGSTKEAFQESQIDETNAKQEDEPIKWTISWNEAMRREHEYKKRMEKFLLQFRDSYELLPVQCQPQEQTANLHSSGLKRKAPTGPLYGDCSEDENKNVPMQKQANQVTNSVTLMPAVDLQCKPVASMINIPGAMQEQNPRSLVFKKITQEQIKRVVPRQQLNQGSQFQLAKKYWCHICKVECPSPESLRKHQQGKRHNNQIEIMTQQKKKTTGSEIFWCQRCNVPCSGVVSMRQHLLGKRHQASVKMLHVGTSKDVDIKNDATNADCMPISSNLYQAECSETIITERIDANTLEPAVPVIENRRLRTSNWPNYL